LLEADDIYKGDRYAEVSSISGDLKRLAMNMHIPIIALSQLNRGSERAAEKEPTMADLRETGNLEQDASVIVLLWNLDPENKELKGCKVEKNRQGLTGTVKMRFDGSQMRFEEIRDEESYQNAKNKANNYGDKKGSSKYGRYERSEEEPQFTF
jgi:replicative DNA helicase